MFQLRINPGKNIQIGRVLVRDASGDVVGAPVDREQAEGRDVSGVRRHEAAFPAEKARYRRRLRRARAAEGKQREAPRVDALLDGHLADRVRLVPVGDLDNALGERFHRELAAEALRQRGEAGAGALDGEQDAAADQRRRKAPERKVGVGDGHLAAAVRIAHWPGLGAGAARADLEVALARDPGDRAAAGADGVDVDHRHAHREAADA